MIDTQGDKPSRNRFIIFTLLFAIAVRIAWIFISAGSPTFPKYFRLGEKLAAAGWIPDLVFASSPLYIYLVGFVTEVLGLQETGLRIIQAAAAVTTIYLAWRTVRILANITAANITALILALYPTLILCETQPVPFVWVHLANAAALFFIVRIREHSTPGNWIPAGIFLGLSALFRPNILLLVPLVFIWLFLAVKAPVRRKNVQAMALIMLCCALVILPISLINRAAEGELTLSTASGGSTMYLGNNPVNDNPFYITPPPLVKHLESSMNASRIKQPITPEHLAFRKAARWVAGKELTARGASGLYTEEVISFATRQPVTFLFSLARKMRHFFHYFEPHDTESAYVRSVIMALPAAPFFVIVWISALWGIWASRERWKKHFPVYSMLAIYFASAVIFYITSRLRMPVLLPVSILAGVGFHDIYRRVKEKNQKAVFSFLFMGTIFTVFSAWPTDSVKQAGKIINFNKYFGPGAEEFFRGDRARGLDYLYKAAMAYPEKKFAVSKLLSPYSAQSSVKNFLASLDSIAPEERGGLADREIRQQLAAANAEYESRNYRGAIDRFNFVIDRSPYHWSAFYRRALCHSALGEFSQALSDLELSFAYGGKWETGIHKRYYEMGLLAARIGNIDKAVEYVRRALFVKPDYGPARDLQSLMKKQKVRSLPLHREVLD